MADILRPVNGVYQCINNPDNKKRYVLREVKGCYPVLVPIEDACEKATKISYYPVLRPLAENACEKSQQPRERLFSKLIKILRGRRR